MRITGEESSAAGWLHCDIILRMDFPNDSELIELGECDSEQELLVVRALLESEGIECCSCPLSTSAAGVSERQDGGLKLYVRKEDLSTAHAILDAPLENQPDASDDSDDEDS